MISSNDLKPGQTIAVDNDIYVVLDTSQNKTARSAMVVKAKVRNLRTGSNVELSWGGGEKVQPAEIEKREMQYLYDTEDSLVFMDNETYDQIEIPKDRLTWERQFMKPEDTVNITSYEGEILGVQLPDKVTLQVVEAEPAVKGDTATSALKNAVLETGLQVKVPLFINQDEMIVINTSDGKYSGRAK
ncbi:MAG: elongation factor P [Absicoccus porci]|mgnify:CR=1 FL=1|jgi:elongation factor P|uniref:Elongation factor P n=1 Tax=Absicoccus porci TaxID=2486576 RepID=A0A3N0I3Y0_9FIRM|nr:elongation factor P [Absicoccus porci]MCI6087476.1 elongation factor P [Absicoccus porci]MDD6459648.1 elongation factor P [Absicoccus porci]MDD7330999.1 elongation factor P [Absicoccus porci]MDY4738896.1 elongation factor P [Absicoccus porci]MEE1354637.1 elongation factor P [Absicoccus porci]